MCVHECMSAFVYILIELLYGLDLRTYAERRVCMNVVLFTRAYQHTHACVRVDF